MSAFAPPRRPVLFRIIAFWILALTSLAGRAETTYDAAEQPRLEHDATVPGALRLSWFGRAGRSYFIEQTRDLAGLPWQYLPVIETGADAPLAYVFGSVPQPTFFVRLRISDQTAPDPRVADFDGDGISNLDELLHHLDPLANADADGDDFPDDWERFYFGDITQTGDHDADQNGDGITDWESKLLGMNPAGQAADRTPPVWTGDGALSGAEESPVRLVLSWPAAEDAGGGAVTYVLYRNGVPQGAPLTITSCEVDLSGLSGWHRWHLRPKDAAGNLGEPSSVLERQLNAIIDTSFSVQSRGAGGSRSFWGFRRDDGAGGTRYFEKETETWAWDLTKYEAKNYDYNGLVYHRDTTVSSGTWSRVSFDYADEDPPAVYSGHADASVENIWTASGAGNITEIFGDYLAAGAFSGVRRYYDLTGGVRTLLEENAATIPLHPVEATRLVSSSPEQDVYEDEEGDRILGEAVPGGVTWEWVQSATRTLSYESEVTAGRVESSLRASLPALDSLAWESGSFCAERWWSGGTFRLKEGEYRIHIAATTLGRRYRVRWLEVFYPLSETVRPSALASRELVLDGTGGVAVSAPYPLVVPPDKEGTLCLVPVALSFDAPELLAVNEDFDERVEPDPEDEAAEAPAWVADSETASPLRADGTLALEDLGAVWIGGNGGSGLARFGTETTGVRLSVVEGADRVRLLAVAPAGSGESGAFTENDWLALESGEELWGLCYGRTGSVGESLPDWTVYLEGLAPGKVVLRLEVDRYGAILVENRTLYVTRVSVLGWDADTEEFSPAGAFFDEESPAPEVAMEIQSAELRFDGLLEIKVAGHVRDHLGELFSDPAHRVAGLVFWVNGVAAGTVANLSAQGTGSGLVPWQPQGSRVDFTRTLVVEGVRPGTYVVEARSTPNLAGRRGSAKSVVRIGHPVIANPPAPVAVDAAFAFDAPLDPAAPDSVRVYRGRDSLVAQVFTETGPDTRVFSGPWTTDGGQATTATLRLARSPVLDPLRIEQIDAAFVWSPAPGAESRAEGRWEESALASGRFVPAAFIDPDPPRELRVEGILPLPAEESTPPRPLIVKYEGIPADLDPSQLPLYPTIGDGVESLVRLDGLDGGGWFVARPGGSQDSPLAFLGADHAWASPGDEVRPLSTRPASVPASGATTSSASTTTTPPSDLALHARAYAAKGGRGEVDAQAYLEAQGYYDEDDKAPEREPLTLEELRGWTLMAYGRPAYLGMILFEEKSGGVVEFGDFSWWSPGKKLRGYELSPLGQPLKLQIDAELEPLRAAEIYMQAITAVLGRAETREFLQVLNIPNGHPDIRFTDEDRTLLLSQSFEAAWKNGLGDIATLLEAQEAAIRIAFSPADMFVTITEALEGDGMAMIAVGLSATPIDNVAGVTKKIIKGSHVVDMFSPVLQPVIREVLSHPARFERLRKARELIATGALPLAKWHEVVDTGFLKLKRTREAAKRAKLAADNLIKKPKGKVLHHYLPLEFEIRFLKAGLDPNDPMFTEWVEYGKHLGWHTGKGLGPGGRFNNEWRLFFAKNHTPTADEALAEFRRLKQQFPHK